MAMIGAHRTLVGVLMAYDSFPDSEWVVVFDDDNYVPLGPLYKRLIEMDSRVPLLLAGSIGPRQGPHIPRCYDMSNATHWYVCTSTLHVSQSTPLFPTF